MLITQSDSDSGHELCRDNGQRENNPFKLLTTNNILKCKKCFLLLLFLGAKMDHPHHDERVLHGDEWQVEALAVIHDVKDHVFEIEIADGSVNNDQLLIHLNVTTKEMRRYCIELTAQGFRVVGHDYNLTDISSEDYYETPYSLLDKLSPMYRQAFGDSLISKLEALHSTRQIEQEAADTLEAKQQMKDGES